MTEQELIHNLKQLKQIKPRKEWAILAKKTILEQGTEEVGEIRVGFAMFSPRLALAPIVSAFIIIGLFGFAQSTIPGDWLFPVKKVTETVQVGLSSNIDKPSAYLKLANKRLEELNKIAESNQVKNLGSAMEAFQGNVSEVTQSLATMDVWVTSTDPAVLKEIVEESQKLAENKQKIEAVLGTKIGNADELENAVAGLEKRAAAYLIADLGDSTLDEGQSTLLKEAKVSFEQGDYETALYQLWKIHNY